MDKALQREAHRVLAREAQMIDRPCDLVDAWAYPPENVVIVLYHTVLNVSSLHDEETHHQLRLVVNSPDSHNSLIIRSWFK